MNKKTFAGRTGQKFGSRQSVPADISVFTAFFPMIPQIARRIHFAPENGIIPEDSSDLFLSWSVGDRMFHGSNVRKQVHDFISLNNTMI